MVLLGISPEGSKSTQQKVFPSQGVLGSHSFSCGSMGSVAGGKRITSSPERQAGQDDVGDGGVGALIEQPVLQGGQGFSPVQFGRDGSARQDVGVGFPWCITSWAPGMIRVLASQHDFAHSTLSSAVFAQPAAFAQRFLVEGLVQGVPGDTIVHQVWWDGVVFLGGPVFLGLFPINLLVEEDLVDS